MSEAALADLLAKQAITERLNDYCRAMDRIDDDLGRSVFHADAPADYGPNIYQGTGYGFIDYVHQAHVPMISTNHKISNVSITVDGDRAGSETYVTMHGRVQGEGDTVMEIHSIGRYLDQWEKRDGQWRIANRRYLNTMDEMRPVAATISAFEGARDRSDPSYAVLGAGQRAEA
ncbi:MAG: nuclear transport factor 2 family protein [Novosphingobium sp.]|nr:nuclear transport factor 2 family protein [Novosphingobium sp.]